MDDSIKYLGIDNRTNSWKVWKQSEEEAGHVQEEGVPQEGSLRSCLECV